MKSLRKLAKAIERGNWSKVDEIIGNLKFEAKLRHAYFAPLRSVEALKVQLERQDLEAARNCVRLLSFQLGL